VVVYSAGLGWGRDVEIEMVEWFVQPCCFGLFCLVIC
jgi:hypothetical protein